MKEREIQITVRRKKCRRIVAALLALCVSITASPYMPASVVVQAAADHDHTGWTAWSNTGAMPGTAGNYYLTSDVSLSGSVWSVPGGTTNLCLNGHTITQNGRARVIVVPRGVTFNLYDEDNRGKITGGSADVGGGISVSGKFTMNGGQVTGNTATGEFMGDGGAGIAVEGGNFTMKGGSICDNNSTGFHGGGITVNNSGTVTMSGGSITGNTAGTESGRKRCGGGVYIEKRSSFTMKGGEISGNTAFDSGGGINVDGTFTMNGGKIIGNIAKTTGSGYAGGGIGNFGEVILTGGTISGNKANYGGGVTYGTEGTMTISGNPRIEGNTKLDDDSVADNLYVHTNKYITIGSGGLKEGAHISVKAQKALSSCGTYVELSNNCDNYSKYFVSDVAAYKTEYYKSKISLIVPHSYSYTSNGAVITRKCSNCSASETATLSLSGGASHSYTGSAITPATVTCSANWVGDRPEVTYKNNMNVGTATAGFTVGGVTASLDFTITPAEMDDVSVSGYSGTYDGISHGITVTAPTGAVVKYGTSSGSCTAASSPTRSDVGTTTVYYQITKSNYNTVNGSAQIAITAKSLTDGMATIAPGPHVYTGNAIKPAVQVKDGSTTLTEGTDYTVSYADNVNKGTAAVTVTGKGNYTGTVNKTFQIDARSIDSAAVTLNSTRLTYNGSEQTKGLTSVIVNSRTLTAGTDYTISGHRQTNAGTHTITLTGTGNYTGTKKVNFEIAPKSVTAGMMTIARGPHYYTGSAVTPAVTVKDSDRSKILVKDSDYTVSYADNINKGTATVTVTGKGNYTGSISGNFTIESKTLPDGMSLADYVTIRPESTDGWYNADITLTPKSGSGCTVGVTPAGVGSAAVIVSQETGRDGGTKTIYVKDRDGNIYQTEFFYKLDKTPPVIDLTGMMVQNGTKALWDWIVGKKSMTIQIPVSDITDASSGIAEVSYTANAGNGTVQAGVLQAQGDYYEIALNTEFSGTIQLTARDNAGNTTQTSLTADGGKVIAEDHAPVVTFALPDELTPGGDGWYNTVVTVTVKVTDDRDGENAGLLSGGIASIRWKEGENGEEKTVTGLPGDTPVYEKSFPISVNTDGTHMYYINATDNAGNESGWQMVTVKVDTELPVFTAGPSVANQTEEGADVLFVPSEGGKVYWFISEAETPPTAQQVKEKSGENGDGKDVTGGMEGSFTISGLTPGEKHTVYVVLEDAAGNLSDVGSESFFTRQKAPDLMPEQLDTDYRKETIKLPEDIGEVEVYTDPDHPSESKITPDGDGSLPVTPGMEIYIRYPERKEDGLTVPASDKVTIQIPDRPVPTDKQVTATDNAITLMNPDSKEEYVLVKKGGTPDWGKADTTGTFTGLDVDTEYDLYVRVKPTENNFVSVPVKREVRTKDHTLQKTEAGEPTCTEAGNREYWTCSDCHKLFADEQGNTETDISKVRIPAAGHTISEQWKVEKEATQKEPGRQYNICETCGIKIYQTIDPLGTPADPYAGKIKKEVEIRPGAPDTVLNNTKKELVQSVLTEGEIAEIGNGADAKIWLEVAPDVDIAEEDKTLIQKAAVESVGAGAEVTCFDASLFKQVGKGEKMSIHYLDRMVSVTIVIPDDIRNKDVLMIRNYQIIRLHDGKADILEGTYKEGSSEFTFETDKFSTYAICYKDVPKQAEPEKPVPVPDESGQSGNEIEKRKDLSILLATGKQKGIAGIKLTWSKCKKVSGYEVYWSYCDGRKNYKKLKTVKAEAKRTYTHKRLKKNRAYKYYIAAYKMVKGKKQYVAKTPSIHVAMNGKKRTNAKKITLNKTKLGLYLSHKKNKKTFQIRAKVKKENSKRKLLSHAARLRYYTDDKTVAKVSRSGTISARGRGTCTVYVIANNGVSKKIMVTVKS